MYIITEHYKKSGVFGITLLNIKTSKTEAYEFNRAKDLYDFEKYLKQLNKIKELKAS